ncbi:amidase [Pseudorhodoplanes sinuspersici]|uniref:Amidase n=1 Tax=Pseudorhodoplanes sinuspersici TaxID=1235591 RepID=A0A1W6ZS71_9HYPH|nr:amidase family protein [Pseudorhodoplanes sinuspersici]ARQ00128.1 amidase [Pseudorhodoplanes sinuspersici]RKE71168.1 aspartyl-tRNA(Asn)/glutamyl-tRNA(Gln) amidotransferase subunit A [Pseudorhodoplanes sinuspersici]
MSAEFDAMSAIELRQKIARKELSPVEVTRRALERAEASQSTLNAFFVLLPEAAMAAAREAEDAVMQGKPLGSLHGIPFSAKDLMAVANVPYASGSRAMANNIAAVDAPAVERGKAAGAILIGKSTTSEFGCKPVGDSPLTGITRNPRNLNKTPGGSSAGAAASVAAGITPFALGTDGGGSIRIPCSLTGLAGIKGHFGRVPVWPTSATPTLAHVGPIARNMEDAALLFSAIAGYDGRDPFSVVGPVPDVLAATRAPVAGMRVALSLTLGYARPDADVVAVIEKAGKTLEDLGCIVETVDTVFEKDPADLWTAEFYAGVGTRLRGVVATQRDLLDPAVAEILEAALAQNMRDYYEKVFERYVFREKVRTFFEHYDALVSPVVPVSSLDVGVNIPPHLIDRNLVSWVYYTYPFNLTGQPATTICAGLGDGGMPVGLQIVGRSLGEFDVVRLACAFERVTVPGTAPVRQI